MNGISFEPARNICLMMKKKWRIKMIFCPKCGYSTSIDTGGNVICDNPDCNWSTYSGKTNKAENDLTLQSEKKETEENSSNASIQYYYYIEFQNANNELIKTYSTYNLIENLLRSEGAFTPFVKRCYQSFIEASDSEIVQFYNYFSEHTISKIAKAYNMSVIYKGE